MKKKKNEYKPQRYKRILKNLLSLFGTAILGCFFLVLGYSVAKPFGEIGETKQKDLMAMSEPIADVQNEETPKQSNEEMFRAYWLKETEIDTVETLESMINALGNEYNMVVVPLKIEGGKLNFASSYDGAVLAEVGNNLELSNIYNIIKNKGYTPAASINTMQDNLYPYTSKNSGFILKDTKKLWLDTQDDKGKPWLNPASTETKQYLSAITGEIAQAGFKHIICTNMEYPSFSQEALDDIGGIVTETDRYLDLVDNVNSMSQINENKGSEMWLEISAFDVIQGTCEVFFKPIMLDTQKYVLEIDLKQFGNEIKIDGKTVNLSKMSVAEKIELICTRIEENIYKSSFIPEISTSYLSANDKKEIDELFKKLGYSSYIIK